MNGPMGGFQNALAQGWQMGTAVRQQREQDAQRNALSGYITNPNDETFGALAQAAPEVAMPIMQQRQQQQQAAAEQQQLAQDTELAMGGDQQAAQRLRAYNFERWQEIDEDTRRRAAEAASAQGQAALYALSQPPEMRAQIVLNYAQQTNNPDVAALAQLPPAELEAALQRAIFDAELVSDLDRMTRPSYQVIPQGGTMVNTRDPNAVASVAQGQAPAAPSYNGVVNFNQWQEAVRRYGSPDAAASVYAANGMAVEVTEEQAQSLPVGTRVSINGRIGTVR